MAIGPPCDEKPLSLTVARDTHKIEVLCGKGFSIIIQHPVSIRLDSPNNPLMRIPASCWINHPCNIIYLTNTAFADGEVIIYPDFEMRIYPKDVASMSPYPVPPQYENMLFWEGVVNIAIGNTLFPEIPKEMLIVNDSDTDIEFRCGLTGSWQKIKAGEVIGELHFIGWDDKQLYYISTADGKIIRIWGFW